MWQTILSIIVDISLGAAALAQSRSARALAEAARQTNVQQDTRLDKLVEVSERHEHRLTRLETLQEVA